jgi:exosortase/archaeosortase family protein
LSASVEQLGRRSQHGPTATRSGTRKTTGLNLWVLLWIVGSILPFTAFAKTLLDNSLADTPYAYLIWVPIFGFIWAAWTLRRVDRYPDDAELNSLMAVPLMAGCAIILLHGLSQGWRFEFLGNQIGLLLWPIWSMALAWLIFGVGITGRLWRPLAYLWLAWPPLYSGIVEFTNPILEKVADRSIRAATHVFAWIHLGPAPGVYFIDNHSHLVPVYISSACSGADSVIAMVTLVPIVLVTFRGRASLKWLAVVFGVVLALVGNLLRLGAIIGALHLFGSEFALGILHPLLGILIFILILWVLMWFSRRVGLRSHLPKRTAALRLPGAGRVSVFGGGVLALTVASWLSFPLGNGTVLHPIALATSNLRRLMPTLPGWKEHLIGSFDESSILGPGARTTAIDYTSQFGDFAQTELWWSYEPITLEGYSEHDCLLFHGYNIVGSAQMRLTKDLTATTYMAMLAPTQPGGIRQVFLDTVYSFSAKYQGKVSSIRVETATPVTTGYNPNSPRLQAIMADIHDLMQPPFPYALKYPDLTFAREAHLYNYFVFVRQFAGKLLGEKNIIDFPPIAKT